MTKKILLFIFFIILFLLIFNNNVFAKTVSFPDGASYDINIDSTKVPEEYKYIIYNYDKTTYPDFIHIICFKNRPICKDNFIKVSGSVIDCRYYFNSREVGNYSSVNYDDSYSWNLISSTKLNNTFFCSCDIYDENENLIYNGLDFELQRTFFNFRYNDLIYSIETTNMGLLQNIAIFNLGNIAMIYSATETPTLKYKNNTYYLCTSGATSISFYDFMNNDIIYDSDYTKFYNNGAEIPFKKEQLIYSNFYLKYDDGDIYFGTVGTYFGNDDLQGNASGNLAATNGQVGDSLLDDYIYSDSNYKGSGKNGSDVIGGGFSNIYNNFGFTEDVKNNINSMIDVITNTKEAPKFLININSKYYTGTITLLDLSWYEPYREYGDTVICIFVYLGFLWRIFIRLPDIIKGAGASSYTSNMLGDIEAFKKTGFGRSSSPIDRTF